MQTNFSLEQLADVHIAEADKILKSCPFFASRSITEHLLRGATGVAALVQAVSLLPTHPFASLGLALLALLAFRGCPMCWIMGLVETVHRRFTQQSCEP